MKRLLSIFSVFAFLAIGLFGFSSDAFAATPGEHLTGTDPISTGCSADAQTVRSNYIKDSNGTNLALLELRYSPTCRTAWGRVTKVHSGVTSIQVSVVRQAPFWQAPLATTTESSTYSLQVNDAGYVANAMGTATINGEKHIAATLSY